MQTQIRHVQGQLKRNGMVNDGKVTVVRCLSAYQVPVVSKQLKDESVKNIEFPVSILSSYSYDGNLNQSYPAYGRRDYERHINIKEDVAVEYIVLWDAFVGNGLEHCAYAKSMFDCEKELWVVDRSITGMKTLSRTSFYYNNGIPEERDTYIRKEEFGCDVAIHADLYKKRPCEFEDIFTKMCINRNVKKIKEL